MLPLYTGFVACRKVTPQFPKVAPQLEPKSRFYGAVGSQAPRIDTQSTRSPESGVTHCPTDRTANSPRQRLISSSARWGCGSGLTLPPIYFCPREGRSSGASQLIETNFHHTSRPVLIPPPRSNFESRQPLIRHPDHDSIGIAKGLAERTRTSEWGPSRRFDRAAPHIIDLGALGSAEGRRLLRRSSPDRRPGRQCPPPG